MSFAFFQKKEFGMKKRTALAGIISVMLLFGLFLITGCPIDTVTGIPDTSTDSPNTPVDPVDPVNPINPVNPVNPVNPIDPIVTVDPVDPAFWFGEVYDSLIQRIGEQSGENYLSVMGQMGQIATTQDICTAINAKWGTLIQPAAGTASQTANCKYLLEKIDSANSANGNSTTFGTGKYATNQVIDITAVNDAVNILWMPDDFVAVAYNSNKTASSTDGISWVEATMPKSESFISIAYGSGKFVALKQNSKEAAYSTDGINWTYADISQHDRNWKEVYYLNNRFVAIQFYSTGSSYVVTCSTDGIYWVDSNPIQTGFATVVYGAGKYLGLRDNNDLSYSTDAITWTQIYMPNSYNRSWFLSAYGNGTFVAIVPNAAGAAYSTNGTNWAETTMPSNGDWRGVTYGNGKFVAIANNAQAAYSTNGIIWAAASMPSNEHWQSVTYGNGKFVAIAKNSDKAACSTDGITWTAITMPSSAGWRICRR
jgi:hypothetical protein